MIINKLRACGMILLGLHSATLWASCKQVQGSKPEPANKSRKYALPDIGQSFIQSAGDFAPKVVEDVQEIPNQRDYKTLAACHIYAKFASHIHKGKLQPNLPGIGIVETTINSKGDVLAIEWIRKPADLRFMPMTEKHIREAAPYPAPGALGTVVHREIWLWTHGNQFQLDSVTEGQI